MLSLSLSLLRRASDAVTDVSLSLMTGFIMNAQLMLYPHASDAERRCLSITSPLSRIASLHLQLNLRMPGKTSPAIFEGTPRDLRAGMPIEPTRMCHLCVCVCVCVCVVMYVCVCVCVCVCIYIHTQLTCPQACVHPQKRAKNMRAPCSERDSV